MSRRFAAWASRSTAWSAQARIARRSARASLAFRRRTKASRRCWPIRAWRSSTSRHPTTFIKTRRQPAGPVETFTTDHGGKTVAREIHTEDSAMILLRYEDETRGALTVSQVSPGRKNSLVFEIDGSTSAAAWNSERPDELWLGHRGRPNEILLRDPALLNEDARAATSLPGGHAEGFADTFKALYAAVYRAVAEGKPGEGYPTFADGHDEMLV